MKLPNLYVFVRRFCDDSRPVIGKTELLETLKNYELRLSRHTGANQSVPGANVVEKFQANFIRRKKFDFTLTTGGINRRMKKEKTRKAVQQKSQPISNAFQLKIRAFVHAACFYGNIDMVHHAQKLLHRNDHRITNFEVIKSYNFLLHSYANKSDRSGVEEILKLMTTRDVGKKISTTTIGHILLAADNCSSDDLNRMAFDLSEVYNIDIGHVFNFYVYTRIERQKITNQISIRRPNMLLSRPRLPSDKYVNDLVEELNQNTYTEELSHQEYEPYTGLFDNHSKMMRMFDKQIKSEINGTLVVDSVAGLTEGQTGPKFESKQRLWEYYYSKFWPRMLLLRLNREIQQKKIEAKQLTSSQSISILPFITSMESKALVNLMMQEVLYLCDLSEYHHEVYHHRVVNLGRVIMHRFHAQVMREREYDVMIREIYSKYLQYFIKPNQTSVYSHRQAWRRATLSAGYSPNLSVLLPFWSTELAREVGGFFYSIILDEVKFETRRKKKNDAGKVKVNDDTPLSDQLSANNYLKTTEQVYEKAFFNQMITEEKRSYEAIFVSPKFLRLIEGMFRRELMFDMICGPSVCPPLPWITPRIGSAFLVPVTFVRERGPQFMCLKKLQSVGNRRLYPIFDSLTQLSSVPWVVNKPMLAVILEVFKSGGNEDLNIAMPMNTVPKPSLPPGFKTMTPIEMAKELTKVGKIKKRRKEMYSLWCTDLYRFSIANHFRDNVLFFPVNIDFRGRCYPIPPHFNHIGDDVARGMLKFAKGQPLGIDGLDWLKIHLINLTGVHKRNSIADRLAYANEKLSDIRDSAKNPLGGSRWWVESDEPWQTLACCMEIIAAIDSGDPENFVSHLAVHQDGSCNGLQHYSALGRDQEGAKQVNLTPAELPGDVYTGVATLVDQKRAADAKQGNEVASTLVDVINRRVVKQTVMTIVYGVTAYGARLQIKRQLKDSPGFDPEHLRDASQYVAKLTFDSLGQIFESTKKIQDWFVQDASLISKDLLECVEWVTPLGLPVIQPYMKLRKIKRKAKDSKAAEQVQRWEIVPDSQKQINGFPPNYIHSLDGTHMMLTSLFCHRMGLTYASVHDCFWTHARTVKEMNLICRDQFVSLHSRPLLQELSDGFVETYLENPDESAKIIVDKLTQEKLDKIRETFENIPQPGTFNIEDVMKSNFFFS